LEGLENISKCLRRAHADGSDIEARTGMSWAAYLSGLTLANAGLGTVHGFASSIGGYFDIPHGTVCSLLMGPVNRITVRKLRLKGDRLSLDKYQNVATIFSQSDSDPDERIDDLLNTIVRWRQEMQIPSLRSFGITPNDFARIISATDNKNNPVKLSSEELAEALEQAL
jgi:alcohol dehydrogenase class IV